MLPPDSCFLFASLPRLRIHIDYEDWGVGNAMDILMHYGFYALVHVLESKNELLRAYLKNSTNRSFSAKYS